VTPPRTLRAAVAGAGLMGRWHADAIARAGGAVAVVADPDARRAAALAARSAGARSVATLAEALAGGGIDVVHVCTPLDTHEPLARAALEQGAHVLVEKPLAPTADATAGLLRLAAERGRLLCPVHQFLFQQGVLRAQEALGALGPLLHADAVACSVGADGLGDAALDRVAAEILPHPLALLARLVPEPLPAARWHVQHPAAGEVRATAGFGAVSASILVSMRGRPTANALRLTAARGTVHVDLFHGFCVAETGAVSRARKVAHPFALSGGTMAAAAANLLARAATGEVAYPGLRELVRRFYAAARDGEASPITGAEAMDVAAARDLLLRKL
jgi:predicted dehydrogenase